MYPHIIYYCTCSQRWNSRDIRNIKLLPFYILNVIILFLVCFGSCLLSILKYIFGSKGSASGVQVLVHIFILIASLFAWPLNFPAFWHSNRMTKYINKVVALENTVIKCRKHVPKPRLGNIELFQLIFKLLSKGKLKQLYLTCYLFLEI